MASGDSDVPLKTRVNRANQAKADAYISKHYNAIGEKWQSRAKGLVTIIHYNSSSTSKKLAQNVHEELWKLHTDHKCINYGVKKDIDISGFSLYVLRNTNMPAILTESGFMDNMVEAKDMLDPDFQRADAEGTCKGICKTFGVKYVEPKKEEEPEDDINNIIDNIRNTEYDKEKTISVARRERMNKLNKEILNTKIDGKNTIQERIQKSLEKEELSETKLKIDSINDWSYLPESVKLLTVYYSHYDYVTIDHLLHFGGMDSRVLFKECRLFPDTVPTSKKRFFKNYIKNVFIDDNPNMNKKD